jgi:hypothetical protein
MDIPWAIDGSEAWWSNEGRPTAKPKPINFE